MLGVEQLYPWAVQLIRVLVIVILAYVILAIVGRLIPRLRAYTVAIMISHAGGSALELEKRAATLAGIARNTAAVLVVGVAAMMVLREVGFDIAPILAGAGVVGLAVGFGAQNLVRDVISGIFLLVENQIRVNDVAIINGTGGLVEEINLRTTVLRSQDGVVHIFPNGTITTLSNMTREYSYYVFDIGVAYGEDTDRVSAVLSEVAAEVQAEERYGALILSPLEILGVDKFADSAVIVKARIKTLPIQQWTVGREINRRLKKKFDEVGIEIPFPQRTLHFHESSAPMRLAANGMDGDQMKGFIRQVVEETLAAKEASAH